MVKDEKAPRGFHGYGVDLMDKIAEVLGFSYVIYEVKDKLYGITDGKGEWNGIVRELIDNKTDIGLALMSITSERESVIDFTVPFCDITGLSILLKREVKPRTIFKFATVLGFEVWLSIVVVFLIVMYCYILVFKYAVVMQEYSLIYFALTELVVS